MHKTVTFSDLILLAYNEISSSEDRSYLEEKTRLDLKLKNTFDTIVFLKNVLDDDNDAEPSDELINRILGYSQAINYMKISKPVCDTFIVAN